MILILYLTIYCTCYVHHIMLTCFTAECLPGGFPWSESPPGNEGYGGGGITNHIILRCVAGWYEECSSSLFVSST